MVGRSMLRRVYADLVRGRSSVRIVAPVESAGAPPVFIIGAYRSGTTLLRLIVDSHSALACPPETTFLAHLQPLLAEEASRKGFYDMGFDRAHVVARVRAFADYFYSSYAASAGKPRWADKSPEYVWHLDWLREVFPNAKFVLLVRAPLDQVNSHAKSGHDVAARFSRFTRSADKDPRIAAARYWSAAVDAQLNFLAHNSDVARLVSYEDVCLNTEPTLRALFRFLGEAWEPEVMQFGRVSHDFGLSDDKARTSRAIEFSSGASTEWPGDLRDTCERMVRETQELYTAVPQELHLR